MERIGRLAKKEQRGLTQEEQREIMTKKMTYSADLLADLRHRAEAIAGVPDADFRVLRAALAAQTLQPHAAEDVELVLNEKSEVYAIALDAIDTFLSWQTELEAIEEKMELDDADTKKQHEQRHAFIRQEMDFWGYAGQA
jgi:hypothetical protein